jgi:hypothetical protein
LYCGLRERCNEVAIVPITLRAGNWSVASTKGRPNLSHLVNCHPDLTDRLHCALTDLRPVPIIDYEHAMIVEGRQRKSETVTLILQLVRAIEQVYVEVTNGPEIYRPEVTLQEDDACIWDLEA